MMRLIIIAIATACVAGSPAGRIVGGEDTTIEEYPHQASVLMFGGHICGGSIIGPRWILTAAHCVYDAPWLSVRVGSTELDKNGVVHKVITAIVHPNYKSTDYDYGLLELETSIQLGSKAQVIALPEQDEPVEDGIVVTVTGYGDLAEGGPAPDVLQVVHLKVVNWEVCQETYPLLTARMLCAGVDGGGKDSCQEDSGGPLISGGKQLGVVSYGKGCGRPGVPGVYAVVANQRDWIRKVTGI